MKEKWAIYLQFIRSKGKPLSEINPGSDEYALKPEDAFEALNILAEYEIPVAGGDILSISNTGKLIYAYNLWGQEYHYLDWYCNNDRNETSSEYSKRSILLSREKINEAVTKAKELNKDCYIVLVA